MMWYRGTIFFEGGGANTILTYLTKFHLLIIRKKLLGKESLDVVAVKSKEMLEIYDIDFILKYCCYFNQKKLWIWQEGQKAARFISFLDGWHLTLGSRQAKFTWVNYLVGRF